MTRPPAPTFPREYLLRVYAAAIDHGHIILHPISEPDATSFTQTFYRLRRRSDTGHATFISPEMHLVTVGRWRPGDNERGELPIYYNSVPSDEPLPTITPVEDTEAIVGLAPPDRHQRDDETQQFTRADVVPEVDVGPDINDYIRQLADKAHKRQSGEGDP